jgi:hypothetical protein
MACAIARQTVPASYRFTVASLLSLTIYSTPASQGVEVKHDDGTRTVVADSHREGIATEELGEVIEIRLRELFQDTFQGTEVSNPDSYSNLGSTMAAVWVCRL